MQIYDFTEPELDKFRELCNFSDDELEYLNIKAKCKTNIQIAMQMHVSEAQVSKLAKRVKDILPSYLGYINVKRKFQLHKTTNENVIIAMKALCTEIKEFIQILYSSTDTPQERNIIKEMLKEMP